MPVRPRFALARRVLRRHPHVEPPPVDPGYGAPQSMAAMSLTEAQDVTVPADAHYVYDLGTSPSVTLGHITINGKLTYADGAAQTLTCKSITNNGVHWATSDGSRRVTGRKLRIIVNGVEEQAEAAYMVDQTGSSGAGNGVLKRLWQSFTTDKKPSANETITVSFTSASAFNVTGSVSGSLGSGTVGVMFDNKVRFIAEAGSVAWAAGHTRTLRVERKGWSNNSRSRGVRNMSGASTILKGPEKLAWTRLLSTDGSLTVSGTVLPLEHVPTGWAVGDRVAVTTTDYYNRSATKGITERFTITAVDLVGKTITISSALTLARCAAKQYVTVTGTDVNGRKVGAMSLTDSGWEPPVEGGARVVDMRAFVLNLTREIVIEAPDDSAWQDTTNGRIGVHVMNMGLDSTFIFDQVEILRGGQRGRHGRYALHNHIPSYNLPDGGGLPSDGTFLGDVDEAKQYVKGCAIWNSAQHGVQNHGACGWKVYETVLDDIVGHGFNLEDGSELRYGFIDCYASECKSIPASTTLQTKAHELGGAGFWLTNLGGDCYGGGASSCHLNMWKSPASRVFGLTRDVDEYPRHRRPGRIEDMTFTSQTGGSVLVMNASHVSDERGAVEGSMTNLNAGTFYYPTNNDRPDGVPVRPTLLKGFHLYKSHGDAYFNRVSTPEYVGVTAADNRKRVFAGAVDAGRLSKSLLVGKSLHDTPFWTPELHRAGSASYHGAQVVQDTVHVNFPPTRPADGIVPNGDVYGNFGGNSGGMSELRGAANQTGDFYQNPIEFTYKNWTGNEFISAEPVGHSREWNHRKLTSGEPDSPDYNTSLAPGVLDAQGWWGPAGWWRTLNLPFYTDGLSDSAPVIMNYGDNATVDPYFVATPDKIYAFHEVSMETDVGTDAGKARSAVNPDKRCTEINAWLQDASRNNIAQYVLGRCRSGALLCHKRFIGFRKNRNYHLSFGITETPSQWSQWGVFAADAPDDIFTVSLPWAAATAKVYMWSGFTHLDQAAPTGQPEGLNFASVANLAALDAHAGNAFWLDTAGQRIHLKYRGGQLARPWHEVPSTYDLWKPSLDSKPNTIYIKP
jgi:hypothetical protein